MITGVAIDDEKSVVVSIDSGGRVTARATAAGAPPVSAPAALREANVSGPLAIASPFWEPSPIVAETIAAIARDAAIVVSSGTAAAAAESWIGAAKGAQDVALFAVETHAIAGLVRDGIPVGGRRGRAASIGWLSLNPVEREDYRRVGCLEAEVGAAGTVRRLVWRIKAGDRSDVQDRVNGDLAAITLDHVLDAARAGDGVALSVMRDTAKYVGMAAANFVAIVDPEMLVLGGIMATSADLLLDAVRLEISRRLPKSTINALTIVPAQLGAEGAAIGAARLASTTVAREAQ